MDAVRYEEMGPDEEALDWSVTRRVMGDAQLMKTLAASQSAGEKHAVIAMVKAGELAETYVSPEAAVRRNFPFNAVEQAFDAYTAGRGVCLVIVRDNKVVISINALR